MATAQCDFCWSLPVGVKLIRLEIDLSDDSTEVLGALFLISPSLSHTHMDT